MNIGQCPPSMEVAIDRKQSVAEQISNIDGYLKDLKKLAFDTEHILIGDIPKNKLKEDPVKEASSHYQNKLEDIKNNIIYIEDTLSKICSAFR